MKKKISILLSVVLILFVGIDVWYNAQIDLMNLNPDEVKVMEIVAFNGNSGNTTHIEDEEQIQYIIDNLNDVEVKRS